MRLTNPLGKSKHRWLALGWVIAGYNLLIGVPLMVGGDRIILAKGAFALYGKVGGLHVHGGIMTGIGVWLGVGLTLTAMCDELVSTRLWKWGLHVPLLLCIYYLLFATVLLVFAPQVGGAFSWLATVSFTILAVLPMILAPAPPPAYARAEEARLVSVATGVGIDTEHALLVAEAFFSGSRRGTS